MAIDSTVTLGNLLTIASMVGGAAAMFFAVRNSVTKLEEGRQSDMALHKADMRLIDNKLDSMKDNVVTRHQENLRTMDSLARSVDDSKRSSDSVAKEVAALSFRVGALEQHK